MVSVDEGCADEGCVEGEEDEVEVSIILIASKEVLLSEIPKRRSVSAI